MLFAARRDSSEIFTSDRSELFSKRGRGQQPAVLDDQRQTAATLEIADLLRNGGLRNAAGPGRAREAAVFDDGCKQHETIDDW